MLSETSDAPEEGEVRVEEEGVDTGADADAAVDFLLTAPLLL